MLEPKRLPPMAGGQVTGGCPVDAFQQACVEVDVAIDATATVDPPAVACIGDPQIGPIGSTFCPPTETPCGFTVAQRLCIGTRVHFQATATPGTPRAFCDPPTFENCFLTACAFFEPRSQGFWMTQFSTTNFTPVELCTAIQCVRSNSDFLDALLVACPAPGTVCFDDPALIAPCVTAVQTLLTQAGAQAAILTACGLATPVSIPLANDLRQFLANWLNVCFCNTTTGGMNVGGVSLDFRVDLTGFSAATLAALGLDGPCETVGDVLAVAENILIACDTGRAPLITPILTAMAADPGTTIIVPIPCP
ncbi:MAG TPA: hypothetical protein VK191_15795 [Symbiobacteriaceae bacterium]|nr:hypothetical protein [Symbiobacteriaceae bacterium]